MTELSEIIQTEKFLLTEDIYIQEKTEEIFFPEDGYNRLFEIEENSYWFQHRNQIIRSGIENFPPDEQVMVDIGGGNGYVSNMMQDQGMRVILFEPGLSGACNAKKRGIKFVVNSMFSLDVIRAEQIPAVALFDVIEHLPDDQSFLRNVIHPALKKNGKIYITVPAYQALWSADDEESGHFRRYSSQTLRSTLEKNGFRVLYITYFFRWIPIPVFLFRVLPSKLHRRTHKSDEHTKSEFVVNEKMTQQILKVFSPEIKKINKQKRMCFGGSLFVVAEKIG